MSETIVEAFTELAPRYERTMDRELRFMWAIGYQDFVRRLSRAAGIRQNDCLLDIATGTAVIPLTLGAGANAPSRIVGIDITPAMLNHGAHTLKQTTTHSRIDLVCGSAMTLGLADASFDAVVCGLAMHHLDVPRTLAEMRRVLGAGGRLVLGVVGMPPLWRSRLGGRMVAGGIRTFYLLTHGGPRARAEAEAFYNLHTEEEWRSILADSGFQDIEIESLPSRFRWGPCALFVKAHVAATPPADSPQ